ncbi:MAG: EamA family transporter [Gammaproteobacteria bacterium]|nr:EamA family transporter [Gammaproteobacteria bacterium]
MEIELWIPITIAAAFLQNVRSLLQKRLTGELSVNGASYVRFCYALPFAWSYVLLLGSRGFLPVPNVEFFAYCLVGGMGQIIGTACLVASFTRRNFAVGTAFSKTEVAQTALIGLVVLGDEVSIAVMSGIVVSLVGVVLLASRFGASEVRHLDRTMRLGLAAGAGFAVAAVSFRGAALSLPEGDFLIRAALALAVSVSLQTFIMGAYLIAREPGELTRVVHAWPTAVWVGLVGMVASAGWFSAMTLENAARVRALGQVELLFTFATSIWFFKEVVGRREVIGVLLIVLGIYLLL